MSKKSKMLLGFLIIVLISSVILLLINFNNNKLEKMNQNNLENNTQEEDKKLSNNNPFETKEDTTTETNDTDINKDSGETLKDSNQKDNPGTTPNNPGTTPSNPGTTPNNPGTTPSNPGTTPSNPGATPSNPGTAPSNPGTTPSNPGATPSNPEPTPIPPPVVETIEQKNDKKRREIESKYGISIKYGEEIGSYRPRKKAVTLLTDPNRIASVLDRISGAFSLYPSGFMKEFKNIDMALTFYLIDYVNDKSVDGVTDKQFYNDIKVTISTNGFIERVLHHEIMHCIDTYLEVKMYPASPYDSFSNLNPSGFVYGIINNAYTYNQISNPTGAYFINNYGQTNSHEDRATIFEDLMSRVTKPKGCYENGQVIYNKAKIISNDITANFNSARNGYRHFERFIK